MVGGGGVSPARTSSREAAGGGGDEADAGGAPQSRARSPARRCTAAPGAAPLRRRPRRVPPAPHGAGAGAVARRARALRGGDALGVGAVPPPRAAAAAGHGGRHAPPRTGQGRRAAQRRPRRAAAHRHRHRRRHRRSGGAVAPAPRGSARPDAKRSRGVARPRKRFFATDRGHAPVDADRRFRRPWIHGLRLEVAPQPKHSSDKTQVRHKRAFVWRTMPHAIGPSSFLRSGQPPNRRRDADRPTGRPVTLSLCGLPTGFLPTHAAERRSAPRLAFSPQRPRRWAGRLAAAVTAAGTRRRPLLPLPTSIAAVAWSAPPPRRRPLLARRGGRLRPGPTRAVPRACRRRACPRRSSSPVPPSGCSSPCSASSSHSRRSPGCRCVAPPCPPVPLLPPSHPRWRAPARWALR